MWIQETRSIFSWILSASRLWECTGVIFTPFLPVLDEKLTRVLGTFVLTEEPVMEPPQKLKAAMKEKGLPETGVFDVLDIGETRVF